MIKLKPFLQTPGFCGPASLKMVMDYYGVSISEKEIAKISGTTKEKGTSVKGLIKAAKHFGFKTFLKKNSSLKDLEYFVKKKIPVIVDWFSWFSEIDGHYSVVVDIDKKNIVLMDPELKKIIIFIRRRVLSRETFLKVWFDFPGKYIKDPKEVILRLILVVVPRGFKY